MRKLYNHTKGKIHPSPPLPPSAITTSDHHHHLSLLPLAIATLAAALSPEDQEVLAYLLSNPTTTTTTKPTTTTAAAAAADHPPQFNCNCFRCYTSFWVRWDSSPNRKMIHEIIDAYEDGLIIRTKKNGKNKKERKNKKTSSFSTTSDSHAPPSGEESLAHAPPQTEINGGEEEMGSSEKGSVRKIVSFIGERIWGVWGV